MTARTRTPGAVPGIGVPEDHEPVRAAHEAGVVSPDADRLRLRPHVGGEQHPEDREQPEREVPAEGAEGDAGEHEDVRVPVEDMVEEVASQAGLPRHLRHLPVKRVEERVEEDKEDAGEEERLAQEEAEAGPDRGEEGGPGERVRVDVDQDRTRSTELDRIRRRRERVGGDDHLVARTDAERENREVQRSGARRDRGRCLAGEAAPLMLVS